MASLGTDILDRSGSAAAVASVSVVAVVSVAAVVSVVVAVFLVVAAVAAVSPSAAAAVEAAPAAKAQDHCTANQNRTSTAANAIRKDSAAGFRSAGSGCYEAESASCFVGGGSLGAVGRRIGLVEGLRSLRGGGRCWRCWRCRCSFFFKFLFLSSLDSVSFSFF